MKCPQCGEPTRVGQAEEPEPVRKTRTPAPPVEDEFASPGDDFLQGLDVSAGETVKPKKPPKVKAKKSTQRLVDDSSSSSGSSYSSGANGGLMLKGILMMVGAVVWFVAGLAAGYIYFYPPFLLIFGLIAFFKGLMGSDE